MPTKDFDSLITRVENSRHESDTDVLGSFLIVFDNKSLTEKQQGMRDAELALFRLNFDTNLENDGKPIFTPDVLGDRSYPDMSYIQAESQLTYYLERSRACSNPRMRARYLDINYEYGDKNQRNNLVPQLVEAYIEASKIDWAWSGNRVDYVIRSYFVARRHKNPHLLPYENAKNNVVAILDMMYGDKDNNGLRWCIDLIQLALRYRGDFQISDFQKMTQVVKSGIQHYHTDTDSFNLVESFTRLNYKIRDITTSGDVDEK